jgi:pheromone shutdown protein TraB
MENENNQQKNITRFKLGEGDSEREVILVGTAHVSPKSAELVREVIEEEQPDSVCIELDAGRFKAMRNKERYQNTDIVKIIKSGKAGFFFANLLLSSYQRRLADQFNIQSGQDMMQGIQSAEDNNAEIVLADSVMSVFDDEESTEDALEELKQEDMLTAALSEMGNEFASVKTVLVDERDQYLAEKIKQAPGKKIVAVLGAAHVPGITQELFKNHNLEKLEELKPKSNTGKIVGWTVTIALILMVAFTFTVNTGEGWAQTRNWLLLVSGGAGLGALAAGGTFLTILTAIVCAPLGAISPVLASGWFSGLAEAHFRKPRVRDFEEIPKDLNKLSGLWKNRVTRILMVVVLTNIGCAIGNIAGGIGIIKGFMDALFI